jgi:hypothetical protein
MKIGRWFSFAAPLVAVACHDSVLVGGSPLDETADAQAVSHDASTTLDAFLSIDAPETLDASLVIDSPVTLDAQAPIGQYVFGNPVNYGHVYEVVEGTAVATPIAVGDAMHQVGSIAIDQGSSIFFVSEDSATSGGAVTCSIEELYGGSSRTMIQGLDAVPGVAADSTYVYFLNQPQSGADVDAAAPAYVERVERNESDLLSYGGPPEVLATANATLTSIAVDGTYVYWTQTEAVGSGSVLRVALAGGTPEILATNQLSPRAIAIDQGNVYWINWGTMQVDCTSTDGSLVELPSGSSAPVVLVSSLAGPSSLAAYGGSAYVSTLGHFCNTGGHDERLRRSGFLPRGGDDAGRWGQRAEQSLRGRNLRVLHDRRGPPG